MAARPASDGVQEQHQKEHLQDFEDCILESACWGDPWSVSYTYTWRWLRPVSDSLGPWRMSKASVHVNGLSAENNEEELKRKLHSAKQLRKIIIIKLPLICSWRSEETLAFCTHTKKRKHSTKSCLLELRSIGDKCNRRLLPLASLKLMFKQQLIREWKLN